VNLIGTRCVTAATSARAIWIEEGNAVGTTPPVRSLKPNRSEPRVWLNCASAAIVRSASSAGASQKTGHRQIAECVHRFRHRRADRV
jgi:hypothetical protein